MLTSTMLLQVAARLALSFARHWQTYTGLRVAAAKGRQPALMYRIISMTR